MKRRKNKGLKQTFHRKIPINVPQEYLDVATYLISYIESYRLLFYTSFTEPPPNGAGYPRLRISPYLFAESITCYFAKDGAAIAVHTGLEDEHIGFLPQFQWIIKGQTLSQVVTESGEKPTNILLKVYDISLAELSTKLSFGLLSGIFNDDDLLRRKREKFWDPIIVRQGGIRRTEGMVERLYIYLEILFHSDAAAWDQRNINVRLQSDIRRDFAYVMDRRGQTYGSIKIGSTTEDIFYERLDEFKKSIEKFEVLLEEHAEGNESLFHDFLKENPTLLDIYGELISKPRFRYPEGDSPLGKTYVEPDFIIKYPGNIYKLIELEKPGKAIATVQGQPRSEVNQSAFQIAEWDTYIRNHYDLIKNEYPSISVHRKSMIVISRESEKSFGTGRDKRKYLELVHRHYNVDEVFTYDDLLNKAKQSYTQLTTLIPQRQ